MPQDATDAVSPLAPFAGSFELSDLGITRRWFDARDLTPELSTEIIEVIRIAFNDQAHWFALPVPHADHFDWKFRDRPTGVTISISVDQDGRVIGFIGGVRRIWHLRGRPYVNRAGYDLCRLPEWQGRGLQRKLQQFRGRDWHPSEDFSLGYATHPADRTLAIERGNKAPANETHDYVRHLRLRPLQRARDLVNRFRSTRAPATSAPLSNTSPVIRGRERSQRDRLFEVAHRVRLVGGSLLARRPAPPPGDWTIATLARFEDQHEPFITEALSQFEFTGDRSIDYLNWRHCDERAGPFTVRIAQRSGQPSGSDRAYLGYAVTRVLDGKAHLVDILALPGQLAVAEALIRDAVALARRSGASVITTRLPKHHPYGPALARAGFFDAGHTAGELLEPRATPEADLAFLDNPNARIHHVLADSDDV
ncbi:MAG: hypothetical protein O3A10_13505 [Chloroflexi bacterium]|nr:hypothetical protein [Chloroflexota bacterium]MDA1148009.1 hypothetical protein [Chloroflexota bacterium]